MGHYRTSRQAGEYSKGAMGERGRGFGVDCGRETINDSLGVERKEGVCPMLVNTLT